MTRVNTTTLFALSVTIIAVVAMSGLGVWQLQRMAHKQQRLSSITQKQGNESLQLLEALALDEPRDVAITFNGTPDNGHVLLLDNQVQGGKVGFDVIVPVRTNAGWLLVNYGWLPAPDLRRTLPSVNISNNMQRFNGVVSVPSRNPLTTETLAKDPAFPALIQEISFTHLTDILNHKLLPYVIYLTDQDDTFLRDYQPVVMPPEKHLGYAMVWFGLAIAAALIGSVAIFKKGNNS